MLNLRNYLKGLFTINELFVLEVRAEDAEFERDCYLDYVVEHETGKVEQFKTQEILKLKGHYD